MSSPVSPPLTVTTVSGTPSGRPITTIRVSNGDLTISGNTATIDTSGGGGGGSGTVTSIVFSSPLTGGTITTTGTVGIPEADGDGYLSSTAYNTFDAKQDAITLTTTGSSGVATFTAGTLNIPNYTNTATIGGSIANTQVAYGSGANTIQGSANLTFDGTNLDVAGYVKSGTGVYDTNGATDLTLQTNSGTNTGKIVIFDGAGSDIEITPEGAGVINLDGLKWPSADGSANQVLQTDGAGTLSFTDGGGSGTVTVGTYAGANNLAYFSGTTEISNTNNISISAVAGSADFFGSVEAGNVKIGTDTNKNTIETSSAQDLVLRTNGGTNSGTITIVDGAGQDIEITPEGAGVINLDGLKWPSADGSANQVLKTDGAGTLSFATVSGGGGIGGSITEGQIAFGSSTADEIEGTSNFTFDSTNNILTGASTWKIDTAGAGGGSIRIQNGGSEVSRFGSGGFQAPDGTSSIPSIAFLNSYQTGFYRAAANEIGVLNNASESFRFGASGELLISGTDAGTSGQVFTSGGASASPTWEDAGGGSGFLQPAIATGAFLTSNNKYPCFSSAPYGSSQIITTDTSADYDTNPCMRPFVLAEGGTWGGVAINVQTASSSNAILISLYNSNSDGMPTSFVGYCEVATTSTGNITQTTTLDSSGSSATITLAKDTQYWCSFVSKASSDSYTLMSVAADSLAGFGGANMQNEYTLLRNTFTANDIETTNPPRNTQTLSDRDCPHIGIII